ncbi:hypothetical protein KNU14_gp03 [Gordonia phage Buggaboo]|uniref:Uncharacterized protein n=1 Tax=Gordonia phage Buggaboo TaxID=2315529 RepID=A0A386KC91_9CAUD|nr:hypothetical protein KNU14_gp03 [Gordonia phage Buggaboo]AVE00663.1 hypothetical protein SEA_SUPERSULLEY_3 [Gordonia phage SuperSulley]AYD83195.1 hypothetical protein SEA_BUGGABOO_3 [Gordonia phage Buggaboo]
MISGHTPEERKQVSDAIRDIIRALPSRFLSHLSEVDRISMENVVIASIASNNRIVAISNEDSDALAKKAYEPPKLRPASSPNPADEHTLVKNDDKLRDEVDHLTAWLMSEFSEVIDAEQSPIQNAIDIIEELREKYRNASEEDSPETVISKAEEARIQATRKLVNDINEQSRRLAGKSEIPPQSIEDEKIKPIKPERHRTNRFKGVRNVETLLGELAGAASMCWAHVERAGEFDSTKAKAVVEEALKQLDVIYRMQGANPLWIAAVDDEETAEDRDAVAAIAARNEAIWMAPGDAAKAFIDGHQRVHILNEPDHGAVTNDLLKMVVEGIDTLTKTVIEIAGGPQDEYAVRAEAQRDVDEEAIEELVEDTTFDNGPRVIHDGPSPESFLVGTRQPWVQFFDESKGSERDTWQGAISKALTPLGATEVINYSLDGAATKIIQLVHEAGRYQEWRQKISGVLGVRPGEINYDLDTAVNKIGELRKRHGARATGDEWRQSIAEALGRDDWAALGLAEAVTTIRDLRRLQSRW